MMIIATFSTASFSQSKPRQDQQMHEEEKPVACGDVKFIIQTLVEKLGSQPIWLGLSDDGKSQYAVVANAEGVFHIIQYNQEIACIIGDGTGSKLTGAIIPKTAPKAAPKSTTPRENNSDRKKTFKEQQRDEFI